MPGKKLAGCHGLGSPPDHRGLWMVERHPDDALDLASDGVVRLDLGVVGRQLSFAWTCWTLRRKRSIPIILRPERDGNYGLSALVW